MTAPDEDLAAIVAARDEAARTGKLTFPDGFPPEYAQALQASVDRAHAAPFGYVCKRCDEPSPVGVGYVAAGADSAGVTACRCGYSRTAD